MTDRIGRTSTEFTVTPEGHREPVITQAHRIQMVKDLYAAGWSYRLIAQFASMDREAVRDALYAPGS